MVLQQYRVVKATNNNPPNAVWFVLQESLDGGASWSPNMSSSRVNPKSGIVTTGGYITSQVEAQMVTAMNYFHAVALNDPTNPANWVYVVTDGPI